MQQNENNLNSYGGRSPGGGMLQITVFTRRLGAAVTSMASTTEVKTVQKSQMNITQV